MSRLLKARIVHILDKVWPFLHQALFKCHILFQWRYATSYKYTVWFNNDHRLQGVWRRAQSICSTKSSQVDQMELQETMAMSITAVYMVPTRFAPLKNRWEAILMVHFHFFLLLDSSHKVLSVLVNNLCVHVKPMYQLYSILKDHDEPPTPDEINIASAKRQLDWKTEAEYLQKLKKSSENIKKAFQNQQTRAIVS